LRNFLIGLSLISSTAVADLEKLNTEEIMDWNDDPNHVFYGTINEYYEIHHRSKILVEEQRKAEQEYNEQTSDIKFELEHRETYAGLPITYWLYHEDPAVVERFKVQWAKQKSCDIVMNLHSGMSELDCGS